MLVLYGMHHFRKIVGHYGPVEACTFCGNVYQKDFIKESKFAHIYYVPLIPAGSKYYKVCPVCYNTTELKSKEAKEEMKAYPPVNQSLAPKVVNHTLSKKYDMYVEDKISGKRYLLCRQVNKDEIKDIEKKRYYKNAEETQVQD